jgi:general secretion pathway protein B
VSLSRVCKPIRDKTMSYILDALKRADAERERGTVPGLHAHQVTTSATRGAPGARNRLGLAIAVVLALAAMAAGLWVWQSPANDTHLVSAQPAAATPSLTAPLTQSLPAASTTAPSIAELPPPVAPAPIVGSSPPPVLSAALTPTPTPAPKPLPVAKIPAGHATPTSPPVAPPLLSELSEDFRHALPPLTVSGAVYSDNPGQRLLLVNGQVVTQGSLAAPDVTLEEIGARSSVFSYRGTRFRLAH